VINCVLYRTNDNYYKQILCSHVIDGAYWPSRHARKSRFVRTEKFEHFVRPISHAETHLKSVASSPHINKVWSCVSAINTHTHTHPFNGPFSGTTQVSRYQKGKTNLDFTEARDSEWQWHQLGNMQVCTLLQTDNHTSTPPLCFLQAGCPSCRPTNSVKALKVSVP